jgi:Cu(I)/Ag(I) efflux system membrane fusion protein
MSRAPTPDDEAVDEVADDVAREPDGEGPEPPPPGVRAAAIVRWVIVALSALVATASLFTLALADRDGGAASGAHASVYRCPMHPQVVSSSPGECPICHMDLELVSDGGAPPSAPIPSGASTGPHSRSGSPASAPSSAPYTCPMHPEVRRSAAGQCPICKMDLVATGPLPGASRKNRAGEPVGEVPRALVPIHLTLDRVQRIGVRTAVAELGPLRSTLRVTAEVRATDEGASAVHVRAPGFVERIFEGRTAVSVGAGAPLFAFYSPEILKAQAELVAARAWASSDGGASPSLSATRQRLSLLGMSEREIDEVATSGQTKRTITVTAPRAGYVAKKDVVLGSYVTPERALYEIVDLSRVYVELDVLQADIGRVRRGMAARFSRDGDSSVVVGKIDLVSPVLEPSARAASVRMTIESAGGRYRPGEYGTVELETAPRQAVTVPRDALIDTGTSQYVFVDEGDGRYSPRTVAASPGEGDRVVIDAGLEAGARVVSGATFLLDSESRLQASLAAKRPDDGDGGR